MAPRVGGSALWYSDAGRYMEDINEILRERPESGPCDEHGNYDPDDDWERMWQAIE